MKPKKLLILGAGAAGSIAANKIARELRGEIARDKLEITILDKNRINTNQAGFTFVPFGLYTEEDITRNRAKLISPRVKTVFGDDGEVTNIDLKNRNVTVKSKKEYSYDYLLIAMGCKPDITGIPGLADDFNSFYTSIDDAKKLGKLIDNFDKGHIVISTVKMPIPCPGAPSKFAVFLDDYLRYVRKVRDDIEITFLLPVPLIGPPQYNKQITKILEDKNVKIIREYKLSSVDADNKKLISADGSEIKYDLLITIPPHKSIKALIDSGITDENGWIPADKNTLQYKKSESESYDEVYVVGDSGPMEILKTGIGAHYQALIAAQNLINDITGNKTKVLYRGETGCPFVESSYTTAARGVGYLPTWTYDKPPGEFTPTKLGWFAYRMYYYIYWDTSIKALM